MGLPHGVHVSSSRSAAPAATGVVGLAVTLVPALRVGEALDADSDALRAHLTFAHAVAALHVARATGSDAIAAEAHASGHAIRGHEARDAASGRVALLPAAVGVGHALDACAPGADVVAATGAVGVRCAPALAAVSRRAAGAAVLTVHRGCALDAAPARDVADEPSEAGAIRIGAAALAALGHAAPGNDGPIQFTASPEPVRPEIRCEVGSNQRVQ